MSYLCDLGHADLSIRSGLIKSDVLALYSLGSVFLTYVIELGETDLLFELLYKGNKMGFLFTVELGGLKELFL